MSDTPAGSFRFRPQERITLNREIEKIVRDGHRFSGDFFSLFWLENPLLTGAASRRFAVRVPHKFGNAVKRNRIKRMFREIFRLEKASLRPGTDLLVILKSIAQSGTVPVRIDYWSVREEFIGLCQKAKIWSG